MNRTNVLKRGLAITALLLFACNKGDENDDQPIAEGTYTITKVLQETKSLSDIKGEIIVTGGENSSLEVKGFSYKNAPKTYTWKFGLNLNAKSLQFNLKVPALYIGLKKKPLKMVVPVDKAHQDGLKTVFADIGTLTGLDLESSKEMESYHKVEQTTGTGLIQKIALETQLTISLEVSKGNRITFADNNAFVSAMKNTTLKALLQGILGDASHANHVQVKRILDEYRNRIKDGIPMGKKVAYAFEAEKK